MTVNEVQAAVSTGAAIRTQGLTKRYGRRQIVHDFDLAVSPGEVYALVGPNGAGKTSVLRLMSGLAFPTSGTVELLGRDPQRHPEVRRHLGAVVEAPAAFYPYLTGRQNLAFHARLAGGVDRQRIDSLLALMELTDAADRKVGVYSLGMRQRLGVAGALLTRPKVLLLDEPASGMDPLSIHLVHRVLREAAAEGAAVVLSTHHLDEVATYCNRVGIMEDGRLIEEVDLAERRARYVLTVDDATAAVAVLEGRPWTHAAFVRGANVVLQLSELRALDEVVPTLVSAGVAVRGLAADIFDLGSHYRERMTRDRGSAPVLRGPGADAVFAEDVA